MINQKTPKTELTIWVLLLPGEGVTSYRILNTKYGPVQGVLKQRLQPVAVRKLRFMPTVKLSPWKELLHADCFSLVCPQNNPDMPNSSSSLYKIPADICRSLPLLQNQSKDCLFHNLYVPESGKYATVMSHEKNEC